jgi:RecA-family ATPase
MADDRKPIARIEDYHPSRRFRPIRFRDIHLPTDRPYLVKGLIPREGLVVIWGPPKCGKSFWTFDLALHIALGWEYCGRRVQQGTVVYVACEGERGLNARSEAFPFC